MTCGTFRELGSLDAIPFLLMADATSAVHGLPVTGGSCHSEWVYDLARGRHVLPVAVQAWLGGVGTAGLGRLVALGAGVVGPYPSYQVLAGGNRGEMGLVTEEDGDSFHVLMTAGTRRRVIPR